MKWLRNRLKRRLKVMLYPYFVQKEAFDRANSWISVCYSLSDAGREVPPAFITGLVMARYIYNYCRPGPIECMAARLFKRLERGHE